MNNNLVSIITPTYNCGPYIKTTIESVLSQTYKDWELIIIDDCSTDNTKAIINKINDHRIQYHCLEKKSGAAVARNFGLNKAKGRWIAFLDSDDLWSKEKLEKQINFMIKGNYHFSYTNYEEMDENGKPLGTTVSGPSCITKIKMFAYCWPGCLTVIYDQKYIGKIQINDIKKNNDYALWLKICRKAPCYLLNESLAQYRRRTGSISNHSKLHLIKWHYKLFRDNENLNPFSASLLTLNNLFWGIIKKIVYVKG
ncbi:MAG: glycosyltransferase [Muribaculaceae bacterium]|nr:glycosyltransferase [Muribaculaceae bacterium]